MAMLITAPRVGAPIGGSYPLLDLVRDTTEDADKVIVKKISDDKVTVSATFAKVASRTQGSST